jgi:hypothetical protein
LKAPALCAVLLAAACARNPDQPGAFSIRLVLDDEVGSYCESNDCADYGMSCGAVLMINMFDLEDGAPVVDECEKNVPPAESICGLKTIGQPNFFNIPPHRVQISVAAWRPGVLPNDECPNEDIFDAQDKPRSDFAPRPAFGGRAFFDAGSDEYEVLVRLACTDSFQLDAEECTGPGMNTTLLRAQVDDMVSLLDLTAERAVQLDVRAAAPRQVSGSGGFEYVIENSGSIELGLEDGPVPSFTADVTDPLGDTVCVVVRDDSAPESTSVASCGQLQTDADPVELRGVLLDKETLDKILAAMGAEFPEQGLVVGRVVDHDGAPLAGVSVSVDGPLDAAVEYLDADLTAIDGTATSASGFFISRDAPFDARWGAAHLVDGRRQQGEPRAGLVRGKVSALIVRMQPP